MKSLDRKELQELLVKCWMTHDGLWFFNCLQECGIEKTNKINRAAANSIGKVEIKRIGKALGVENVGTFRELKELIEAVSDIVKADFMDFTYSFSSENVIHWEMGQCFAYDGIKKMGVIEQYQCGIFARVEGWFEGLGIRYEVSPQVGGCMKLTDGSCFRDYRFSF